MGSEIESRAAFGEWILKQLPPLLQLGPPLAQLATVIYWTFLAPTLAGCEHYAPLRRAECCSHTHRPNLCQWSRKRKLWIRLKCARQISTRDNLKHYLERPLFSRVETIGYQQQEQLGQRRRVEKARTLQLQHLRTFKSFSGLQMISGASRRYSFTHCSGNTFYVCRWTSSTR